MRYLISRAASERSLGILVLDISEAFMLGNSRENNRDTLNAAIHGTREAIQLWQDLQHKTQEK